MIFQKVKYGYSLETETHFVFFGNKDSQLQNLKVEFPNFEFLRVHQVHGDRCVQAKDTDPLTQADAHRTNQKGKALLISTADCMPVVCYSPSEQKILAIHAGWRGVENRITLSSIKSTFQSTRDLMVYVGPHILKDSFEIESELAERIIGPDFLSFAPTFTKPSLTAGKVYMNLFSILSHQLQKLGLDPNQIQFFEKNTVTDAEFHSHRRDREKSGRQLSFIALK